MVYAIRRMSLFVGNIDIYSVKRQRARGLPSSGSEKYVYLRKREKDETNIVTWGNWVKDTQECFVVLCLQLSCV